MNEKMRCYIDRDDLSPMFPTDDHDPHFWEMLGRAVATFGYLERTLGKAIIAFAATTPYTSEEDALKALDKWAPKLFKSRFDTLQPLIKSYGDAVRGHPQATIENLDELLERLEAASKVRNVICHAKWPPPGVDGYAVPEFFNTQNEAFDTPVDIHFLIQLQRHVSELICEVISTVTSMGWQFPSMGGPGDPISPLHK